MITIKHRAARIAIALSLGLSTNLVLAQTPALAPSSLDALVRAEITPFKGKVFLFAKNLDSGSTYSFNGDDTVRTASTIKVAVMVEVFTRVAEGRSRWTDELVLTKASRYGWAR